MDHVGETVDHTDTTTGTPSQRRRSAKRQVNPPQIPDSYLAKATIYQHEYNVLLQGGPDSYQQDLVSLFSGTDSSQDDQPISSQPIVSLPIDQFFEEISLESVSFPALYRCHPRAVELLLQFRASNHDYRTPIPTSYRELISRLVQDSRSTQSMLVEQLIQLLYTLPLSTLHAYYERVFDNSQVVGVLERYNSPATRSTWSEQYTAVFGHAPSPPLSRLSQQGQTSSGDGDSDPQPGMPVTTASANLVLPPEDALVVSTLVEQAISLVSDRKCYGVVDKSSSKLTENTTSAWPLWEVVTPGELFTPGEKSKIDECKRCRRGYETMLKAYTTYFDLIQRGIEDPSRYDAAIERMTKVRRDQLDYVMKLEQQQVKEREKAAKQKAEQEKRAQRQLKKESASTSTPKKEGGSAPLRGTTTPQKDGSAVDNPSTLFGGLKHLQQSNTAHDDSSSSSQSHPQQPQQQPSGQDQQDPQKDPKDHKDPKDSKAQKEKLKMNSFFAKFFQTGQQQQQQGVQPASPQLGSAVGSSASQLSVDGMHDNDTALASDAVPSLASSSAQGQATTTAADGTTASNTTTTPSTSTTPAVPPHIAKLLRWLRPFQVPPHSQMGFRLGVPQSAYKRDLQPVHDPERPLRLKTSQLTNEPPSSMPMPVCDGVKPYSKTTVLAIDVSVDFTAWSKRYNADLHQRKRQRKGRMNQLSLHCFKDDLTNMIDCEDSNGSSRDITFNPLDVSYNPYHFHSHMIPRRCKYISFSEDYIRPSWYGPWPLVLHPDSAIALQKHYRNHQQSQKGDAAKTTKASLLSVLKRLHVFPVGNPLQEPSVQNCIASIYVRRPFHDYEAIDYECDSEDEWEDQNDMNDDDVEHVDVDDDGKDDDDDDDDDNDDGVAQDFLDDENDDAKIHRKRKILKMVQCGPESMQASTPSWVNIYPPPGFDPADPESYHRQGAGEPYHGVPQQMRVQMPYPTSLALHQCNARLGLFPSTPWQSLANVLVHSVIPPGSLPSSLPSPATIASPVVVTPLSLNPLAYSTAMRIYGGLPLHAISQQTRHGWVQLDAFRPVIHHEHPADLSVTIQQFVTHQPLKRKKPISRQKKDKDSTPGATVFDQSSTKTAFPTDNSAGLSSSAKMQQEKNPENDEVNVLVPQRKKPATLSHNLHTLHSSSTDGSGHAAVMLSSSVSTITSSSTAATNETNVLVPRRKNPS